MQEVQTGGRDRRLIRIILVLGALALFFVVIGQLATIFFYFSDILLTFFLAWLLAFIISPIVVADRGHRSRACRGPSPRSSSTRPSCSSSC